MAILFTYTEATNTVVLTGGTADTPATFANFVTADRAGSAELLAATNCAKDMTLTYQVRPCEEKALLISFIIASKTAENDYIWVTGTDAWGTALSEAIDISAGNGTYVSTRRFATITDIDIEDVGDGSGTAAADGTLQVTQPQWGVIWDYGNGNYYVKCTGFNVGNGSTSTYFKSTLESVTLETYFQRLSAANLQIGNKIGDWGYDGSTWRFVDIGTQIRLSYGVPGYTYIYASHISTYNGGMYFNFRFGAIEILNSIFNGNDLTTAGYFWFQSSLQSLILKDVNFTHTNRVQIEKSGTIDGIQIHYATRGIRFLDATTDILNYLATEIIETDVYSSSAGILNLINWRGASSPTLDFTSTATLYEKYICNIKVRNNAGVALQSVVVDCEDANTDAVWAAGTVSTDASGDIAEQQIAYKKWYGASETLTEYSPHKFTFSKAGYKTLVKENITVDRPIVWEIELQYVAGARNQTVGMGVRMS